MHLTILDAEKAERYFPPMESSNIWVGAVGNLHVVHDPGLKVDSARWVALFLVPHSRLELYTKWYARCAGRTLPSNHDAHGHALTTYEAFRRLVKPATLESLRAEAIQRDALFDRRLEEIVVRHKKRTDFLKLPYRGVREPARNQNPRESRCYKCFKGVDSSVSPSCEACGWIVCDKCGACGCGWAPTLEQRTNYQSSEVEPGIKPDELAAHWSPHSIDTTAVPQFRGLDSTSIIRTETYVRAGDFVGRIRGPFEPRNEYHEFRVFDPISKKHKSFAAILIVRLSEAETAQHKATIDRALEMQNEELKKKHIAFLRQRGITIDPDVEYTRARGMFDRAHRASVCYSCHTRVDNEAHEECTLCKWIICPDCAACGCGYE